MKTRTWRFGKELYSRFVMTYIIFVPIMVNKTSIDLSLSGLPFGATGTFNPVSGNAENLLSTLGITTSNTSNDTYVLTVAGTDSRPQEGGTRIVFPTLVVLTPQQDVQLIMEKD